MLVAPLLACILLAQQNPVSEPRPGALVLPGVVLDLDGRPLAGVDVWLASGVPPSGEQPMIGWMQMGRRQALKGDSESSLSHTLTDRDGRFRIEVPADIVRSQEPLAVGLWAAIATKRIAWRRLPWALPPPAQPVRLVIEKPSPAGFRLMRPDGAPAAGARVLPRAVDRLVVPREVGEMFAAVAGPDGVLNMPALAPGELRWAQVELPGLGTQVIRTLGPDTTPATAIRLEPAGRVSGRVIAEPDKPVAGLPIHALTFPDGYDLGGTLGAATVLTDGDGRFEIPAIAAGRLALVLDLRSRSDLPYRGLPPVNQVVEAGRMTTVRIQLKRVVRLEGVIRERGTGTPIEGVSPEIPDLAYRLGGNSRPVTDAAGRFEGYMEGEQPYAFLYATPKPYFIPERPDSLHLVPPGATEFKLPPTELVRGSACGGWWLTRPAATCRVRSCGLPGAAMITRSFSPWPCGPIRAGTSCSTGLTR